MELPRGNVVQKVERRRSVHGDVIDAVVHQVRAHGVVAVQGEGDLQLSADAIHAGPQHGIARQSFQ